MISSLFSMTLGWVPFVDPIPVHTWWYWLLIPMAFGISMIYKAIRVGDLRHYWLQVLIMTVQIVLGMIALAIALGVLVQWVIPAIPVD